MKEINRNTMVVYKCVPRNAEGEGYATVPAGRLFNFDAFNIELNTDEREFIGSLNTEEFVRIPQWLADPTNYQNFLEYVKLASE